MKCSKCGSRDIDFQEAGGQSICVNCGTILEENTIVSSIEFQETGDRSHVIGQYVSANCTKPFVSSSRLLGRHLDGNSRDTTLFNARKTISQLSSSLKLPPLYIDRAYRLYQLALQRNFIFGRRQTHVSAACLYIICRQEKSPHLLIDFSDALQINVYLLGKAFLHFLKVLNLNLPVIDPSLFIHRFASKLNFGDKMNAVVISALRIITRLKKDWIAMGRRPDGICAAALLVSARANGFDVSQENIAQLFKIAEDTLRKRLYEFKNTPSAQLNLQQFHVNDIELEYDPPSYINGVVDEYQDSILVDLSTESLKFTPTDLINDAVFSEADVKSKKMQVNEIIINVPIPQENSMNHGTQKLVRDTERENLYQELYLDLSSSKPVQSNELHSRDSKDRRFTINVKRNDEKGGDHPQQSSADTAPINIPDLSNYIFSEEEQIKRAAIWEKTFGPFMEERARRKRERAPDDQGEKFTQSGKLKKKYSRKANATASDAVLSSQGRVKGASKKINYDALKGVFNGNGNFAVPSLPLQNPELSKPTPPPKLRFNEGQLSDVPLPATQIPAKKEDLEEDEEEEDMLLYDDEAEQYDYDEDYF